MVTQPDLKKLRRAQHAHKGPRGIRDVGYESLLVEVGVDGTIAAAEKRRDPYMVSGEEERRQGAAEKRRDHSTSGVAATRAVVQREGGL